MEGASFFFLEIVLEAYLLVILYLFWCNVYTVYTVLQEKLARLILAVSILKLHASKSNEVQYLYVRMPVIVTDKGWRAYGTRKVHVATD